MKTTITVTDQFCGAGGSSQGASNAISKKGGKIAVALNHWKLAIETHNTNFPDTIHDCTDISACDPRRYPSTTILITSPECTNHSIAKGKKQVKAQLDLFEKGCLDPGAERSRATMWDVPRFAEYHKYKIIIVENVVDARKWVMFPAWLNAMHLLGYKHKCVYANSMHFEPCPQSRDRMYVVFWKKGNREPNLELRPLAYSPILGKNVNAIQWWKDSSKKFGKYKQQYLYRCPETYEIVEPYYHAAFNAIDWSDIGTRIGDRKKELSLNTIKRIEHGLKKYANHPFQVINYTPGTAKSIEESFSTITTKDHHGLCTPFIIKGEHTLVDDMSRSVFDQLQTQCTRQTMSLVTPWIIEMNSSGECKPATDPTSTFTAGGINHGMLVGNSFIDSHYGNITSNHITESIGTCTTKDRHALVSMIPKIEDCYYRMLFPREVKKAMAFNDDYIVLGSGKDQVRQLGNAVTPPAMEWLVSRCVESLEN